MLIEMLAVSPDGIFPAKVKARYAYDVGPYPPLPTFQTPLRSNRRMAGPEMPLGISVWVIPVPEAKVNPTFCDVVMAPMEALASLVLPEPRLSRLSYWYVEGVGMLPEVGGGVRLM